MFARLILSSVLIVTLAALPSLAQETAEPVPPEPATQPATVPADATTPKGALKVLTIAMHDGDAPTLQSLIMAETPLEARMREAQIELAQASAALRRALVASFGEQVLAELEGAAAMQEQLASIDAAEAEEHDGWARVNIGFDQYDLQRIDGQWRLSLAEAARKLDAQMLEQSLNEMSIRSEVYEEVAGEVAEGAYQTTDEVGQALQGKLMVAMMRQAAEKQPPATQEGR